MVLPFCAWLEMANHQNTDQSHPVLGIWHFQPPLSVLFD
jgi:hypothetical protein